MRQIDTVLACSILVYPIECMYLALGGLLRRGTAFLP